MTTDLWPPYPFMTLAYFINWSFVVTSERFSSYVDLGLPAGETLSLHTPSDRRVLFLGV